MTEYLLSIIGIVLISTILTNVLPSGKTSALIKNIVRLCLYLVILSPAYEFFQTELSEEEGKIFQNYFSEEVIQTDGAYIDYCSEKSIEETENLLEKKLKTDYEIIASVTLVVSGEEVSDSGVKIKTIQIFTENISEEMKNQIKTEFYEEFQVLTEFAEDKLKKEEE